MFSFPITKPKRSKLPHIFYEKRRHGPTNTEHEHGRVTEHRNSLELGGEMPIAFNLSRERLQGPTSPKQASGYADRAN